MLMERDNIRESLQNKLIAYKQLFDGSGNLLESGSLYWTEKLLLKLTRIVAEKRLKQLADALPSTKKQAVDIPQVKQSMMEASIEATLGGHDLESWEQVGNDYQAQCQLCKATVWVGKNGLRYSILDDTCLNHP